MKSLLSSVLLMATLLFAGSAIAQPMRTPLAVTVPVQGLLTDSNGVPLNATVSIRFRLYADQVSANPFWEDTYTVQVGALFPGVFSVSLGSGSNQLTDEQLQTNNSPWMGMRVGSDAEMPRWALERTPFAAFSNLAGDSSSGNGIPTGGIVWSEDDNDQNLTGAGFTRMPYTIEAKCDDGADCSGTASGGGSSVPAPQWGSASISTRASLPQDILWTNAAAVPNAGCGNSKMFYMYSMRTSNGKVPYRYCTETDSWSSYSAAPGDYTNRYAYAAAALRHSDGGYRYHIVGGNQPSRRHDVYNPSSNSWSSGAAYPSSRYCLRGAVVKNKWYVFGGSSASNNGSPVSTSYSYDPLTNNWTQIGDLPSGPRAEHVAVATRGKIYVLAGRVNGSLTSRMDMYDPDTNQYQRVSDYFRTSVSPQARGLGGRVVVHGGSQANSGTGCSPCFNDYRSWDPDTGNWTNHGDGFSRKGSSGGTAFAGAAVIGDCMHVAGGEPWQTRHDRLCVPGAAAYDETFETPSVTLRAYRAP